MNKLLHFIQYHNAVPLAVTILVMGSGVTFAATNPEAIYSAEQQVISIDNTYLVNKDLSAYSPRVEITGVTEDSDTYYVAYNFLTIDLADSVWKDVVKNEVMKVSKADLGPYRDLGLYVTAQLRQKTERELAYLMQVKEIESKNVSQKVVATIYGGLVGKMLDTSTETLPGYTPVVVPPPAPESQIASAAGSSGGPSTGSGSSGGSSQKIGLQILGNNPARIAVGTSYVDLGAVLIDPYNTNVGVHAFQDGVEVIVPSIDTSTTSVHIIEYRATDPAGSTIMVRRAVLIGDVQDPGGEISSAGNVTVSAPAPAPAPEPTPTATSTPLDTQGDLTGQATTTPDTTTLPDTSASTTPAESTTPPAEPAPVEAATTTEPAATTTVETSEPAPAPEPTPTATSTPLDTQVI